MKQSKEDSQIIVNASLILIVFILVGVFILNFFELI